MKKIFSLLFCFVFLCNITNAQEDLIPVKKLKKDFKKLVGMIEAHPKPYRHQSEEQFEALINNTKSQLNAPMNVVDFFKLTSPIISAIKDGHTSLRMPRGWLKKYRKSNGVFPYKVYLSEENRLYIIDNYGTDETIPLGSEILALNQVPVATFLEGISPYIAYERENFRNSLIERSFDLYLMLYFGSSKEVSINYMVDAEKEHTVSNISYDSWKDELEDQKKLDKKIANNTPYEFKKLKGDIGYLKIYSFAISDGQKYSEFLRKMFSKIEKENIGYLIIDVRGNTGGFPKTVSDLIHYVSEKYFKTMAVSEMKVSDTYQSYYRNRTNFNPHRNLILKRRHYIDITTLLKEDVGTVVKEAEFFNELPKKMPTEFQGDVFLLIDKTSYSASSSFAATFRCYQLGLLIGEETGGTKVFHANSISEKLQHSGLYCFMATNRNYTACFLEEDEGIQPDLPVTPTIPQLVAKQDVALNYAMLVVKKVKKMKLKEGEAKK